MVVNLLHGYGCPPGEHHSFFRLQEAKSSTFTDGLMEFDFFILADINSTNSAAEADAATHVVSYGLADGNRHLLLQGEVSQIVSSYSFY